MLLIPDTHHTDITGITDILLNLNCYFLILIILILLVLLIYYLTLVILLYL